MSEEWKSKFIELLSKGIRRDAALEKLNVHKQAFEDSYSKDHAFHDAVYEIENGAGSGNLCVAELARLREAQVTEQRAAGYFRMTLEDFRKALDANPELKHVYNTAPLKGQAQIQVWQYESAASDGDMQKWLGKNYLDQADKSEVKHTTPELTDPDEILKRVQFINASIAAAMEKQKSINAPVIHADCIDITPTDNQLAISSKNSDNDLGPA